jgi:hypothetical protein
MMMITILRYERVYIGRIGQVTALNRRSLSGGPEGTYRHTITQTNWTISTVDEGLDMGNAIRHTFREPC